jgi:hypothetical protein
VKTAANFHTTVTIARSRFQQSTTGCFVLARRLQLACDDGWCEPLPAAFGQSPVLSKVAAHNRFWPVAPQQSFCLFDLAGHGWPGEVVLRVVCLT